MFSIFSCAAGSRTPADSKLSVYLLQEGKEQVKNTGQFTTLDGDMLRINVKGAEVLAKKTTRLVWKIPAKFTLT